MEYHPNGKSIAVLIPCFNEETTIEQVISDFQHYLPEAKIYVYDNNSTDLTASIARRAGAIVKSESRQGKGNVIRTMFREIDADIYVLIDGDSTYPVRQIWDLVNPVVEGKADMVGGDRLSLGDYSKENNRKYHHFGNEFVKTLINKLFGSDLKDIMTGYRAFNRIFVKTIPIISTGFTVETEITLHALDKKMKVVEVPINYQDRPEGSQSKLNTFYDGFSVLMTIFILFKNFRPFLAFSTMAIVIALTGIVVGIPPIYEYFEYSYVYKVPSAILAASLEIVAMLFFFCGIILDTIVRQHKELHELRIQEYILRSKEMY